MNSPFTTEVHPDGVAEVVLNQPPVNALNAAGWHALAQTIHSLGQQSDVRVIVIRAEGRGFCAGVDIKELNADQSLIVSVNAGNYATFKAVHLNPVPVIAAVHGAALGGGIQVALGADLRLVHPEAQLSVRELHWGLVPDMTGTLMLARLVRPDIAKELTFTARIVSGTEAVELGLCTRLSDDPRRDALALAGQIAASSPDAVRGAKALFNRMLHEGAAEQFAQERRVIGSLIGSPNQIEAVMANFEKRPARFSDPG